MHQHFKKLIFVLVSSTLLISAGPGCGGDAANPLVPPKTLLYLLDTFHKAVFVVDHATTVDGAVDPARTISGDKTLIENPTALAVDNRRDILYVADANQQAVLVFAPASTQNGDVTPIRQIPAGGNIQSMTLDEVGNRLYVFNATNLSVQVWDHVSTVNGNPPDRTFTIGFLASALFIDNQRNFLYVGDPIAFSIDVYAQASTLIGSPLPTRIFFDDEAQFDRINSLSMNVPNDLLYMANSLGPLINVFIKASDLNQNVDPDRIVEGDQTDLSDDLRYLKFLENTLYVVNQATQVAVWNDANTIDGNLAPNRLITVNGSTRIIAFDVDLSH